MCESKGKIGFTGLWQNCWPHRKYCCYYLRCLNTVSCLGAILEIDQSGGAGVAVAELASSLSAGSGARRTRRIHFAVAQSWPLSVHLYSLIDL